MINSCLSLDHSRSSCDFDQEYLGARHYFSGIIQDDRDSGSVMVSPPLYILHKEWHFTCYSMLQLKTSYKVICNILYIGLL